MKLTEKEYWNAVYAAQAETPAAPASADHSGRTLERFRLWLREYLRDYDDYLLWESLYPRLLPLQHGLRLLEIGSAPGTTLLRMHDRFGYVPFGVEYSDSGAELNRETFRRHGVPATNVIHADVFSEAFQQEYREHFDLVMSGGFIEHFMDVREVIARHLSLLKPGGFLIITIPRLTKINYLLCRLFHPEVLALHNLHIMEYKNFAQLFEHSELQPLFCNYLGTFSFSLFNTRRPQGLRHRLLRGCKKMQLLLNLLFRLTLRSRGLESGWSSPHLIFIGIRNRREL